MLDFRGLIILGSKTLFQLILCIYNKTITVNQYLNCIVQFCSISGIYLPEERHTEERQTSNAPLTSIFVNSHCMASDSKNPSPVMTTVLQKPLQFSSVFTIEGGFPPSMEQSGPRNGVLHVHTPTETFYFANYLIFNKNITHSPSLIRGIVQCKYAAVTYILLFLLQHFTSSA